MNCENIFCIYQSKSKCILENVDINNMGMCADCIYPDIDEKLIISPRRLHEGIKPRQVYLFYHPKLSPARLVNEEKAFQARVLCKIHIGERLGKHVVARSYEARM